MVCIEAVKCGTESKQLLDNTNECLLASCG